MKATELEFLKYVYDHINIEDLWEIEEGFKTDCEKELPEGYEENQSQITENKGTNFWEDKECYTGDEE